MSPRSVVASWFLVLLVSAVCVPGAGAGRIAFGLAELPGQVTHGDSYVISFDESQTGLIEHARALVEWVAAGADPATSPGGTIVVAEIAPGADGFNRNYLAAGDPLWSWHLVGTPSFADITIEILDGWPTFVEQDIPGWIANTNGNIGFWNYTVVAELGAVVPEPSTIGLVVATLGVLGAAVWRRNK